ncbi:MAG: sulfatase [Verrucomicrobiaceae bacterium]|nr:sulfatase [Verrucomicrobiaceae bacterium]
MNRLAVLLLCIATPFCRAASERPNILFVLADNWYYPHAAANGDPAVRTPVFDRIAREGARFTHAFCPVPSCSPTRSCILTGRAAHQLEDAASLWSLFPSNLRVFTDDLTAAGYHVGYTGKGWSPGNYKDYGRSQNPAGPEFKTVTDFLDSADAVGKPFFYWLGDTHTSLNKWIPGSGRKTGIDPAKVVVPACLPDVPEVREEIADYLASVQQIDEAVGAAVGELEKRGILDNTIVIYTSDNGWQMPRGLANCYDTGTRIPLAIRWPGHTPDGKVLDDFISLTDCAPTFLELAGVPVPPAMTGRSFVDILEGKPSAIRRDQVFLERERHANVRRGDLSYPIRAIRTADFLYLRNLRPDRWPAGDPELYVAVGDFGDIDGSRTKQYMWDHQSDPSVRELYKLSFEKRPAEELYDLRKDPDQMRNLATDPELSETKAKLRQQLDQWMKETHDPRLDAAYDAWDHYPYFGGNLRDQEARRRKVK